MVAAARQAGLKTAPKVPEGERVYAVGDIHGCLPQLKKLMEMVVADAAKHASKKPVLVFLGDYIDRGMHSAGVIDYLLSDLPEGMARHFLRGNHEDMILRFVKGDMATAAVWLQYGGQATLLSYGSTPPTVITPEYIGGLRELLLGIIPPEHLKFFADAKLYLTRGDYCFVHAGIRPNVALDNQTNEDFLWIRKEFLASQADHAKMIVHGHSISTEPEIHHNRIGIDTGAYATGRLTCLVLQGETQNIIHT